MFLKQRVIFIFFFFPPRSCYHGLATCSNKLRSLSCFQLRSRGLQSAAILDYTFHRAVGLDAVPRTWQPRRPCHVPRGLKVRVAGAEQGFDLVCGCCFCSSCGSGRELPFQFSIRGIGDEVDRSDFVPSTCQRAGCAGGRGDGAPLRFTWAAWLAFLGEPCPLRGDNALAPWLHAGLSASLLACPLLL